jgi:precorrin-6x reductase
LPFKKKEEYFANDFINRSQLIKWCESAPDEEVKNYILELGKKRIERKKYKNAPFHLELLKRQLPDLDIYKKHFGTYTQACEAMGVKPIFYKSMPKEFMNNVEVKVLIDTREQQR